MKLLNFMSGIVDHDEPDQIPEAVIKDENTTTITHHNRICIFRSKP